MTNFFIVLLLGGGLGWVFTARTAHFASGVAIANILVGIVASMAGAAISQPSLYSGLTGRTFALSISATLIALGALELVRNRKAR